MKTHVTIDKYSITSYKKTDCRSAWLGNAFCLSTALFIVTMFWTMFLSLLIPTNYNGYFTSSLTLTLIFMITSIILLIISNPGRCGIVINLEENGIQSPLGTRTIILTNDVQKDTAKAKQIIDEYKITIHNLIEYANQKAEKEKELETQCCDKYKNILKHLE